MYHTHTSYVPLSLTNPQYKLLILDNEKDNIKCT